MILIFILLGALCGLIGGWITGAVLYKNFENFLLRMIAVPFTIGSAAAFITTFFFGDVGVLGFLAAIPAAFICLGWIRCIEPRLRPESGKRRDFNQAVPAPEDGCQSRTRSEAGSAESEEQWGFAALGAIAGVVLGGLGWWFFDIAGGAIGGSIVAALVPLLCYGTINSLMILVDTLTVVIPIIWDWIVEIWNCLIEFLDWIVCLLSSFLSFLTGIGNRIGAAVRGQDRHIDRH